MATPTAGFESLVSRAPEATTSQLLAELVPPREFSNASFKNYVPNDDYPSQLSAVKHAKAFAAGKVQKNGLFTKSKPVQAGLYLDGGFGVGKTHLLASVFHEYSGKKAFGSFIAYTGLIGALGFASALAALSKFELICIDEFELDDPGDTMMMSRLINELAVKGIKFAATSNTPPNALGEGRFAAEDFIREIHGIANQFEMLRIDGEDYRHRPLSVELSAETEASLDDWLSDSLPGAKVAKDDFESLLKHLSKVHPSRYGRLIGDTSKLAITSAHVLTDQAAALRFVSFVDRAYESQMHIRSSGTPLTEVFLEEHIAGGYRKKYLRAISRLGALAS